MNTQLIPVFAGELSGASVQLVDARLLHSFLEVGRQFTHWIQERIEEYGFIELQDFLPILAKSSGGRPSKEYHLTLDMAKELAMVERNEKGRQARRYFIEMERQALQRIPEPKTKKAIPGGLTLDQQDAIKAMVKERVEVLPKDKQAKAAITCWSSIKAKFGAKTYKAVAPEHFTQIISLIARLPLDGEVMPTIGQAGPYAATVKDSLAVQPPTFKNRRFLISYDDEGRELVAPVPLDCFVISASELQGLWDGLTKDFCSAASRINQFGRKFELKGWK